MRAAPAASRTPAGRATAEAPQAEKIVRPAQIFDNTPAGCFRIARVAIRADHRLTHSRLAFIQCHHLDWRCIPPPSGEVWSLLRRLGMKTCSFVAAMRFTHPEFAVPPPKSSSPVPEGVARRKTQSYGIAISTETARAPLGAPASAQAARSAIAQTKDSAPSSADDALASFAMTSRTTGPRFRRKCPPLRSSRRFRPLSIPALREAPREK